MRIRNLIYILTIFSLGMFMLCGCQKAERKPAAGLQVVTTLFPLYDFARSIAGEKAQVTMLLPPGVEPHTFEPKPEDMIRINRAGLFIYTNPYMEPWAETVVRGVDNKGLKVVNAGQKVRYRPAVSSGQGDHNREEGHDQHGHKGLDPHIWLDFANAATMVDAILEGFVAADAANADFYRSNAEKLKAGLASLDQKYRDSLASCTTRKLLHGGHYTFGYLANRYNLEYHALSGVSSDSEPSASRMVALVGEIRSSGARYLFAEELLSPRLTETLAKEAGVG
ncbi:MAG: zinc ABC transporter substrate-binding protein, partial [Deltaproteobacteria bacterium]|nr:zinc ABC transporter substrate-binding protein [Deltaproteobacteria bacterium]